MEKKKKDNIQKATDELNTHRKNIGKIEVELIPEILGKTPKEYEPMDVYNKYLPMQQQPDRVLAQKELYEINNMLISYGHKPLPVGTRSKAAARKLNKMNLGFRHSLQELHQLNRADQKENIQGLAKDYKMKGVREAAEEIKKRR